MKAKILVAATVTAMSAPGIAISSDQDRIAVQPTIDFSRSEGNEQMPGGAATSLKRANANAFSHSSRNLNFAQEMEFKVGNAFFRRLWVSAPASTRSSDGLGPIFNARSCQRCHLKDGRGHPPRANWPDDNAVSMFLRLSIPPETDEQRELLRSDRAAVIAEPTYGGQLQDFAVQGLSAEGRMHIRYAPEPVTLADGTVVELRKPTYSITDLAHGPLHPKAMLSPRVAPPMIGLGLLEMIGERDILSKADPEDRNGDGISGKSQSVWDVEKDAPALGRFGWKAGNPSVRQQSAGAFAGDIGISNPVAPWHWGDCTSTQSDCRSAPSGATPEHAGLEASEKVLSLVTFYSRNLAVPKRRHVDAPKVLAGKKLFYETGCIACHTPKYVTAMDPARPEHSGQLIWPYTDLLLHDMGDGLADGRPEGRANGWEWRTPPLWGIGLTETVNGHTNFLHDGRARNFLEAILWHGGEAEPAKERVRAMRKAERDALIAFLNSQ